MRVCLSLTVGIVSSLTLLLTACTIAKTTPGLLGSWRAETYDLADGRQYPVSGQIVFTESDWTVLYFVTAKGKVARGAAEGGSYVVEEKGRLVFHHLYNLTYGEGLPGLPATDLHMQVHDQEGVAEPCRYQLEGNRLELFFPSGNVMLFRRSSH